MRLKSLVPAVILALCQPVFAADFTADITVYPIENFKIGSSETNFGPLRYVGGFAMTSGNRNFGALSAIRLLNGSGTRFAAIADTGFFISGAIIRDSAFKPVGMGTLAYSELTDVNDQKSNKKWFTDAESLVIDNDQNAIIGFEGFNRLSVFPFDGVNLGLRSHDVDFLISKKEIRMNRGFETLAKAPDESTLQGALVAVSEKSLDANGHILAAVLSGPQKGVFKVARFDDFDITDGDFLPNGDLLLLERSFSMSRGIRMRLRQFSGAMIKPGAVIEGAVVVEADMSAQIDNMEGLDVWQAADGTARLSLISDDNKSILQRNLYLEFVLKQ
jgi:hypothetical protein